MVINHIGFIMDGNRRLARRFKFNPTKGHELGAEKLKQVLEWCRDAGIKEVTVYALSAENINRPKIEVDFLFNLFKKEFEAFKKDRRIFDNEVRINVIGDLSLLPDDVSLRMREIIKLTENHNKYIINFAIAYGGRDEIVMASKRIAKDVKKGLLAIDQINKEMFAEYLYLSSEPDLTVRTGGEIRTSNFLNYQSAYSEWFFIDKMWPEFEKEDFDDILIQFSKRKRRFGK